MDGGHGSDILATDSSSRTSPATPFKSMAEVVALSKKEPNKWNYGTSGIGGPAMTDLLGGQVPILFSSPGPSVGAVKGGMDAINATGCDVEILAPAQTVERIKADAAKWGRVVRDANIKAE
jgi:hypothetical protein